jgi:predicted membrane protein
MKEEKQMSKSVISQRKVIAVILIVLAVLIFFNNIMNWHLFSSVKHWWPLLLIVFGLSHILSPHGNKSMGTVTLILGVVFQLIAADRLHFSFFDLFWPAILIIIGLNLLKKNPSEKAVSEGEKGSKRESDVLDLFAILSGSKHSLVSSDFKGGSCMVLFGGMEVDLSEVQTQQKEIVISVTALFGGIDIAVPRGWKVITRGTPILGGFDDDRKEVKSDENAPILEIRYFVMFGGASIVNEIK